MAFGISERLGMAHAKWVPIEFVQYNYINPYLDQLE